MENVRKYKFVLKIALTFRLSLENVCKIMGKEATKENKNNIFMIFEEIYKENDEIRRAYNFLFNYETIKQTKEDSDYTRNLANMFLKKYNKACKDGNVELVSQYISELNILDNQYHALQRRERGVDLTDEQALIISKYRAKYALSREQVCNFLDVSTHTMQTKEDKMNNDRLKKRIDTLNDFYLDVKYNNLKRSSKL